LTIRPFTLGDIFLLQHLSRYATQLHIEKTLMQPRSPMWSALRTSFPWRSSSCITYVLRQEENGLARAGLIQLEVRPERHEACVMLLAPALDAPQGHPAVWQKLLAQSVQELGERQITRLYCDLPDQPLLVNTFKQAGFQLYSRETIWRQENVTHDGSVAASSTLIRPQQPEDEWQLLRLYNMVTPAPVQQAEARISLEGKAYSNTLLCPILDDRLGLPSSRFVLDGYSGLEGSGQIIWGKGVAWIRLWVDTNNPNTKSVQLLLRHALAEIADAQHIHAVYIAVRIYQEGIEPILCDYGFAPFTDRARMVRNIWQWAHRPVVSWASSLEAVREAVPGSLAMPKAVHENGAPPVAPISPEETWTPL
jgi:hypothetical protein